MRHVGVGGSLLSRLRATPRAYYGMLLAHVGIAVFVTGVTLVKGYEAEKDVRMATGDTVELGGHVFRFEGVTEAKGPNYVAARATLAVTKEGQAVARLQPERRVYRVQESPMTEAAIDYGLFRHLYVALSESVGPDTWIVRVHYKPFIAWIWSGCLLMAFGGLLAATDRRYRVGARAPRAAAYAAAATR
ncbi:Cytochrome c-type biogenesis protein CcmF [compost metagenome]